MCVRQCDSQMSECGWSSIMDAVKIRAEKLDALIFCKSYLTSREQAHWDRPMDKKKGVLYAIWDLRIARLAHSPNAPAIHYYTVYFVNNLNSNDHNGHILSELTEQTTFAFKMRPKVRQVWCGASWCRPSRAKPKLSKVRVIEKCARMFLPSSLPLFIRTLK